VGKLGSALACLLFAIPFGGVGVFATWTIGSTLHDAWRARDWVRVMATVEEARLHSSSGSEGGETYKAEGRYRYAFAGAQYTGSRLGLSRMGGSDNIDDWHQEVNARLAEARSAGRPVPVWVNPGNPAESVFDRELRWGELLFLVPFSLAFGGVGVGALVAMVFVLKGKGEGGAQDAVDRALGSRSGATGASDTSTPRFLWIFAFFWNALSWPIAILALGDIVENGEWVGLLVLLFPLVGLGLLWAAVSTTWNAFVEKRRGVDPARARARPAPASMAAQAARAMFDPQGGAPGPAVGFAAGGRLEVPPAIAEVEERGGVLTLRYRARRRLGLAIALAAVGAFLALVGAVLLASGGSIVGAVALLATGILMDLGAAALLVGRLEVVAKPGELAVERAGLTGRQSWRIRRDSIEAILPVNSYSINDVPYFSLHAEAIGERIPLGNSIKGEALAIAIAGRIAGALGLDPGRVAGVSPGEQPSNSEPSAET
jgi:hypothetical protein